MRHCRYSTVLFRLLPSRVYTKSVIFNIPPRRQRRVEPNQSLDTETDHIISSPVDQQESSATITSLPRTRSSLSRRALSSDRSTSPIHQKKKVRLDGATLPSDSLLNEKSQFLEIPKMAPTLRQSSSAEDGIVSLSSTSRGFRRQSLGARDEEVIRLMLQSLYEYGFVNTAASLEKESGFQLEPEPVSRFRDAIMAGNWQEAENLLPGLDIVSEFLQTVLFLIRKRKYLELLDANETKKALLVLRYELATLNVEPTQLHELSSLMMTFTKDVAQELPESARSDLLIELQKFISPSLMIPTSRLDILLKQAVELQKKSCMYHNTKETHVSLYEDHSCDRKRFPNATTHILEEHTDEVWFLAFSNDGKKLASASKDSHCIIWDVDTLKPIHDLQDHVEAISFLCWSPDGTMLLTASNDHSLKLWAVESGQCTYSYTKHTDPVTSCAWLPDNQRFVSGSLEKNVYLWNIRGDLLYKWPGVRIMDLAVSIDGNVLIAASEKKIRLYDLNDKCEIGCLQESDSITSVYVAGDGRHLLVNLSIQEIHLWDMQERQLIRKYVGQKQGRFVIRSCFGGINENFVLSGSEDSQVYIWHRESGKLVESLEGHSGCCNCVAWNPSRPMFASASDDNTIRIWGPELT